MTAHVWAGPLTCVHRLAGKRFDSTDELAEQTKELDVENSLKIYQYEVRYVFVIEPNPPVSMLCSCYLAQQPHLPCIVAGSLRTYTK
jgi:hypothetical protein